jgi:hypothetical protein
VRAWDLFQLLRLARDGVELSDSVGFTCFILFFGCCVKPIGGESLWAGEG